MAGLLKELTHLEDQKIDEQKLIKKVIDLRAEFKAKKTQMLLGYINEKKQHNIYLDSKCCATEFCIKRELRLARDDNYDKLIEEGKRSDRW